MRRVVRACVPVRLATKERILPRRAADRGRAIGKINEGSRKPLEWIVEML